jgi:WD40 repeat protein
LSFTPDGKYLVSSELLGTILIWELETGRTIEIPVEQIDQISIQDSSLSLDGDSLVVLFRTGRIVFIDLSLTSWQRLACQRANRNLTQEEWQQFFGEEPYRETCEQLD